MLRRNPGFAAVVILVLALGIGANTAIFSVVNSLLLRTLPVREPQRLVTVSLASATDRGPFLWTYAVWNEIRQQAQTFDGAFAWSTERFNLAQGGEIQPVDGLYVSGDFFTALGVPALLGRTITSADDVRGGGPDGPVAVISYGLWQRRFGGVANVIGTPIVVERVPFTIIGVTPPSFFGAEVGRTFDVALPLGAEPLVREKDTRLDGLAYILTVMLRLKPEQSLDAATATLRGLQPQIREATAPTNAGKYVLDRYLKEPFTLVPSATGNSSLRRRYERPLLTIMVIVALVLLIACVNIANLLLARATARRHELSVRLALGAPRWRLAGQLLVESVLLAGIGALVGLAIAVWGSRTLVAQLSMSVTRVFLDLSPDWRVLAFTIAVTIATAVLFGTVPAFRATRVAPIDALKEHGRFGGRASVSNGLVIAQVALSLMLVVAAGLFIRTFERLATLPLGFDRAQVLLVNLEAPRAPLDVEYRLRFYQRLVAAVAAVPGVAHAAGSIVTPVSGGGMNLPVDVSGAPPASEQRQQPQNRAEMVRDRPVLFNFITPGWLATYGTTIRTGRDIDDRDTKTAPPVVLVNNAFVRRFFPGRNAIGGTMAYAAFLKFGGRPKTIVGVVSDAVYFSLRDEVEPTVYVPLAQWDIPRRMNDVRLSVRSLAGRPESLAPSVAAALTAIDRDLVFSFRSLEDQVNASLSQERLVAMLSGFFGALALLLAGLGLYGVTSYGVIRRRSEIGIRTALGAQRSDVIGLVLRQTILLTVVGMALGLAGASAVTRYLEGMLFGVTPLDPTTFLLVSLMFASVAMLAAYLPARRATKVDPLIALRCE